MLNYTQIVKKLVILPQSMIDYVQSVSKSVSDPRAKKGNFSKGLQHIIAKEMKKNGQ
jgi:hypothetical protein